MLDLMMLGWPWFAGAAAVGAFIGYVATSHEKNAAVAPGWVFILLALTLAAGAAVSASGGLDGRAGLAFDIGLVVAAAYAVGMPIGRAFKRLGAQTESEIRRPVKVAPIIVKTADIEQPAADPAKAPTLDEVAVAVKALSEKAVTMRASDRPVKAHPGARPATLAAGRADAPDDLCRIKGLGPKSAQKLNALGIFHYDQIAGWSRDNAKWIGAAIGVAGRVERDDWIGQARKLAALETENAA